MIFALKLLGQISISIISKNNASTSKAVQLA